MSSSLILQRFSEGLKNPEVLTNPQKFLGLHSPKVLEFWNKIENLTQEQLEVVKKRHKTFFDENYSECIKAANLAYYASIEVVGWEYAYHASWAAYGVATDSLAPRLATREILGNVENPTFLKMFDNL
jgi:hypothetical protein